MIVETTRSIIDAVKPKRTYYTLETMPWAYPDSPDSYLALLQAIDRERFAVHLDPVNLICSPQRYYSSGRLIRECFEKLGPHIKSCHAKDILLQTKLTTHPGRGSSRPGGPGLCRVPEGACQALRRPVDVGAPAKRRGIRQGRPAHPNRRRRIGPVLRLRASCAKISMRGGLAYFLRPRIRPAPSVVEMLGFGERFWYHGVTIGWPHALRGGKGRGCAPCVLF